MPKWGPSEGGEWDSEVGSMFEVNPLGLEGMLRLVTLPGINRGGRLRAADTCYKNNILFTS